VEELVELVWRPPHHLQPVGDLGLGLLDDRETPQMTQSGVLFSASE
jgi:hypothetical protein